MRAKPWAKFPTDWIRDGRIRAFSWKDDGSGGTAALMIFYALCQFAYERPLRPGEAAAPRQGEGPPQEVVGEILPSPPQPLQTPIIVRPNPAFLQMPATGVTTQSPNPPWSRYLDENAINSLQSGGQTVAAPPPNAPIEVPPYNSILQAQAASAPWGSNVGTIEVDKMPPLSDVAEGHVDATVVRLTYEDIGALTGLSRKLIAVGIQKLVDRELVWRVDGAGSYGIFGLTQGKHWVKMPGQALMSKGQTNFMPFAHFFLRGKHELNALKVYFYYAVTRDRSKPYSEPSFETIFARTGVAERDIPTANSLLITSGFLARTRSAPNDDAKQFESNHYYMTGYSHLFLEKKASAKS